MRNVLDKICRENKNTHFIFSDWLSENRAIYEIMLKNIVEPETPKTTWRIRVLCWIRKAIRAHTHAQKYLILIAFRRQQWFGERTSLLLYTYIASFAYLCVLQSGGQMVKVLKLAGRAR